MMIARPLTGRAGPPRDHPTSGAPGGRLNRLLPPEGRNQAGDRREDASRVAGL